jgi:uncharacterized phage-associated protein
VSVWGSIWNLTKRVTSHIKRLVLGEKAARMIPYRKEKLENAICFFALNHRLLSGKPLTQTYLYKYLAFLDFRTVRETGIPALDLEYRAMERGPVPHKLYNERHDKKTESYEFIKQEKGIVIIEPKANPNLDYFSDIEKEIMVALVRKYAKKYSTTDEICEDSHKQILAWQRTYSQQKNKIIDYKLMFRDDILSKKEEDLTPAEESYLTFIAFKSAPKCR